jgi:hypothetical protein
VVHFETNRCVEAFWSLDSFEIIRAIVAVVVVICWTASPLGRQQLQSWLDVGSTESVAR